MMTWWQQVTNYSLQPAGSSDPSAQSSSPSQKCVAANRQAHLFSLRQWIQSSPSHSTQSYEINCIQSTQPAVIQAIRFQLFENAHVLCSEFYELTPKHPTKVLCRSQGGVIKVLHPFGTFRLPFQFTVTFLGPIFVKLSDNCLR